MDRRRGRGRGRGGSRNLRDTDKIKTSIVEAQGIRRVQIESSMVFDGKRMRQAIVRRPIDYNHSLLQEAEFILHKRTKYEELYTPPHVSYSHLFLPPSALDNPAWDILTHFAHASTNKIRCPINSVLWTPDGRRLMTGGASGEFTLWNGMSFNFETIQQAHDSPIRCMIWSNNDNFMVSGEQNPGYIKYWQPNMNNLKTFLGHEECVRDLTFCRTNIKFASCSDDTTVKIWDFETCTAERILAGHGADVKCADWHPYNSLVASGSKDYLLKLWDSKSGTCVANLYGHKNTIFKAKWNRNGNWIISCGRDQLIKLFDIRFMKDVFTFKGHKKEVTTCMWHPFHEKLFVSGGYDGEILWWIVGSEESQGRVPNAHEGPVWDLKFHPMGHVLCSGSGDFSTKFWSRNKLGDKMLDKYNIAQMPESERIQVQNLLSAHQQLKMEQMQQQGEDGKPSVTLTANVGMMMDEEEIGGDQLMLQQLIKQPSTTTTTTTKNLISGDESNMMNIIDSKQQPSSTNRFLEMLEDDIQENFTGILEEDNATMDKYQQLSSTNNNNNAFNRQPYNNIEEDEEADEDIFGRKKK